MEKKKPIKNNILNKQTLLVNTGCVSVEFVLMCNSEYSNHQVQKIDSNSTSCMSNSHSWIEWETLFQFWILPNSDVCTHTPCKPDAESELCAALFITSSIFEFMISVTYCNNVRQLKMWAEYLFIWQELQRNYWKGECQDGQINIGFFFSSFNFAQPWCLHTLLCKPETENEVCAVLSSSSLYFSLTGPLYLLSPLLSSAPPSLLSAQSSTTKPAWRHNEAIYSNHFFSHLLMLLKGARDRELPLPDSTWQYPVQLEAVTTAANTRPGQLG